MPVENGSQASDFSNSRSGNLVLGEGLLRSLKGAPLSVLIALAAYGKQSRVELVERTGWGYSTVQHALAKLEVMRVVTRSGYRCWSFARQERLGAAMEMLFAAEVVSDNISHTEVVSGNTSEASSEKRPDVEVISTNTWPVDKTGELVTESTSVVDKSSEVVSDNTSVPPYDHDGVIINNNRGKDLKHHPITSTKEVKALAQALKTLNPPFEHAETWLQKVSPRLVAGWLDHLQNLDHASRAQIRNEAAFLRWKVQAEQEPPPRPLHRLPCEWCGKTIRDANGRCLVCLGIVIV